MFPHGTTRSCAVCGTLFTPRSKQAKYCSHSCRVRSVGLRVSLTCEICGQSYTTGTGDAPNRHTCSMQCRSLYKTRKAQQRLEEAHNQPITTLLADLYYTQRLGVKKIARQLGVSDRVLWNWMNELGLARRTRSEAVAEQWRDNAQRRKAVTEQFSAMLERQPLEQRQAIHLRNLANMQAKRGGTSIERRMMDALAQVGISYQHQYNVGNKFLCDFAVPEAKLIIECDGKYWHGKPQQQQRDASKDAYLRACGYTVLRFGEDQINHDIDSCITSILAALEAI